MIILIKKLINLLKIKTKLNLPNGNFLYYTRKGFGIEVIPENRIKSMYCFSIQEQMYNDPNFITNHPKLVSKLHPEIIDNYRKYMNIK